MVAAAKPREIESSGESPAFDKAPNTREYGLARAIRVLDRVAGTWSNEFVDEPIEDLYRGPLTGSHPLKALKSQ